MNAIRGVSLKAVLALILALALTPGVPPRCTRRV